MIWNLTKKIVISRKPVVAESFLERGVGMIGRDFKDFDAMIFHRCGAVHTMFMGISIDILFVDSSNRICGIGRAVAPWKPLVRAPNAETVIELPSGTVERTGTEENDVLDLNAELSEPEKLLGKVAELPVAPNPVIPCRKT